MQKFDASFVLRAWQYHFPVKAVEVETRGSDSSPENAIMLATMLSRIHSCFRHESGRLTCYVVSDAVDDISACIKLIICRADRDPLAHASGGWHLE